MTAKARWFRAFTLSSFLSLTGCGLGFGIDLPSGRADNDSPGGDQTDVDLSSPEMPSTECTPPAGIGGEGGVAVDCPSDEVAEEAEASR